jgi:nicotinamide-nucleotide amidase
MQDELATLALRVGTLLAERKETVAVAESSAGGLIAAALLSAGGASRYFLGGAVNYTRGALLQFLDVREEMLAGLRPVTRGYALFQAERVRVRLAATWGIAETGAAGPTGNRYGDPPGRACVAVSGRIERARMVETGRAERVSNMYAFAGAALQLLEEALAAGSD